MRAARHVRLLIVIGFVALAMVLEGYGQTGTPTFALDAADIAGTVESFKTNDIAKSVSAFSKKMPEAVTDAKLRQGILNGLPAYVAKLRVNDRQLEQAVRELLRPILALYSRESVYDLILIRHPTPLVFSDSGVVIVMTTGALLEMRNDDELLGVIAHEIGHEYFAQYSIYTRHLLTRVGDTGKEPVLTRHLSQILTILELQCDAFAAITVAGLGYDPFAFLNFVERVAKKFPDQTGGFHPAVTIRREIVAGILPGYRSSATKKGLSPSFSKLKVAIEKAGI